MHGRKKSDQKSKSEAEKEALKAKVANYQQLAQLALSRRKTGKGVSLQYPWLPPHADILISCLCVHMFQRETPTPSYC